MITCGNKFHFFLSSFSFRLINNNTFIVVQCNARVSEKVSYICKTCSRSFSFRMNDYVCETGCCGFSTDLYSTTFFLSFVVFIFSFPHTQTQTHSRLKINFSMSNISLHWRIISCRKREREMHHEDYIGLLPLKFRSDGVYFFFLRFIPLSSQIWDLAFFSHALSISVFLDHLSSCCLYKRLQAMNECWHMQYAQITSNIYRVQTVQQHRWEKVKKWIKCNHQKL